MAQDAVIPGEDPAEFDRYRLPSHRLAKRKTAKRS